MSWMYLAEEQAVIVSSIGKYCFVIWYYHSHKGIEVSIYYSRNFSNFKQTQTIEILPYRESIDLKINMVLKTFNMISFS
jgi:hypothetical protein